VTSPVILVGILVFGCPSVHAASLQTEAVNLRAKCIANAAAVASLDLPSSITLQPLTGGGTPVGQAIQGQDRVRWSKGKGKLKWARANGDPRAYVADGNARTLTVATASGTTYTEPLSADQVGSLAVPFPGWLWQPSGLIPVAPVQVREESGALVLVSGLAPPAREVWLDRITGNLVRFTETDATGRVVRTVTVSGWSKAANVWLPTMVDDVIQGTANGLHRMIRFESPVANPVLSDADFQLP